MATQNVQKLDAYGALDGQRVSRVWTVEVLWTVQSVKSELV